MAPHVPTRTSPPNLQRLQPIVVIFLAIVPSLVFSWATTLSSVYRQTDSQSLRFLPDRVPTTRLFSSGISGGSLETTQSTAPMKLLEGMRNLIDDHDVFLLDMWGCMHDGEKPYDGVLDVVQKLKDAGKKMIILSNSSKRKDNSIQMLKKLGFDPDDFDQIITSGEVSYQMLSGDESLRCEPWDVISGIRKSGNLKVFVLGSGDGDQEYCEDCGWKLAPVEEASLIIARGTFSINDGISVVNKTEEPERYENMLEQKLNEAAVRRIPMLVANPDKIRPDVERPPMPGKIGDTYEQALGGGPEAEALVKRIGKPFHDVYDIALRDATATDLSRICMVGDALETDVTGGSSVGIKTVWVIADGIHGPDVIGKESLLKGAMLVLDNCNAMEGTYAKGRSLSPSFILQHFRY
jgi:HAD superfamily hydrolase (TIGR01459 family)